MKYAMSYYNLLGQEEGGKVRVEGEKLGLKTIYVQKKKDSWEVKKGYLIMVGC